MRPETSLETKATFWLARRLPACDAITASLSEALERPLTRRERTARRLHFRYCDYCLRYERQLLFVRRCARLQASGSGELP
jgi:hypothetical protein